MNEFYRAKFNELFMEFSRYLITHPDFGENSNYSAILAKADPTPALAGGAREGFSGKPSEGSAGESCLKCSLDSNTCPGGQCQGENL